MFKVVENGEARIFKTWAGCLEHQRLLVRQNRKFTVYEKVNGKWIIVD